MSRFNRTTGTLIASRKKDPVAFKLLKEQVKLHAFRCQSERTEIIPDYITRTVNNTDYIVIVGRGQNRQTRSGNTHFDFSTTMGFALVKEHKTSLYIELICGAGFGKVLFKKLEALGKELGKSELTLSALPGVMMQYYGAYGFKFSETCAQNVNISNIARTAQKNVKDIIEQIKQVTQKIRNASSKPEATVLKRKLTQLINKSRGVTLQLQKMLIHYGLVYRKGCGSADECGEDGYTMTKCI